MTQIVKYLKDYAAPNHLVPKVDLLFDIQNEYTDVIITLHIEPQNNEKTLILQGDAKLLMIQLNGERLAKSHFTPIAPM